MQEDVKYIDDKSVVLTYRMPWQEVVTDLHDVVRTHATSHIVCLHGMPLWDPLAVGTR